ncbi:hypothetical protein AWL63_10665 [Sphingomonas panacis]|uniref:DUF5666 domain-containing protein n=1 Tax=Sphingomonas panacis TaxID=1560345 RepID=A0A1B3ZAC0_9SPHN|nr:hypothetical protein [Sphingomonas panacis]AOH84357.1 hypothetical protein AWL63_10665 [Sphingomonas panacis]
MYAVAVAAGAVLSSPAFGATILPPDTIINVTPSGELTSKKMKAGDKVAFQLATDVVEGGTVVLRRGAPVVGEITWKTGKAIGGKSAKFEVTFLTVSSDGHEWKLKGKYRQEGKGNTVAALLGSILISGHSATMSPGQIVTAFTAEPIPAQ